MTDIRTRPTDRAAEALAMLAEQLSYWTPPEPRAAEGHVEEDSTSLEYYRAA